MLIPLGVLAAAGAAPAGAYELISTTLSTGSTTTVSFNTSGLSAYKHLQIRMVARNNLADYYGIVNMRFNSDTTAKYSMHRLEGRGGSVISNAGTDMTFVETGYASGNSNPSGRFVPTIIDILDFNSTTKFKTSRCFTGQYDDGGEVLISLASGLWRSTSAITSIDLYNRYGTAFASGSRISLYGLRG